MRAGHEGGHLFVADLDELRALTVAGARERTQDAVDAVPGIAVDAPDAPSRQPFEQVVANGVTHARIPFRFLNKPASQRRR
jgi:hypothetical protein